MDIDKRFDSANNYFQKVRQALFLPILKLLSRLKFTANIITNLRLVLGLLFFLIFTYHLQLSLIILFVVLFLDILDGPLARYQNSASDRGKFLDMVADNVTYSLVIFTFLYSSIAPLLILVHLISINYVYFLAVIKKNEFKRSDWIIKPSAKSTHLKILPFIAFYIFHIFNVDYLSWSLYISTFFTVLFSAYYYIFIQIRWGKIHHS